MPDANPGSSSCPTLPPQRPSSLPTTSTRAWEELGPHLLHDAMTAASYRHGDAPVASISTARTVEELRGDTVYRILTIDEAAARVRGGNSLPLLPLCGGLAPDVAWPYLERAATAVVRARS